MTHEPHEHALRGCFLTVLGGGFATFVLIAVATGYIFKISSASNAPPGYLGDPQRGRALVARYGCSGCHEVPGIENRGAVGPPLVHMASRSYVAGRYANLPVPMIAWIEHPQRLKPGTAMPELGVSHGDAVDIAAYLATLK